MGPKFIAFDQSRKLDQLDQTYGSGVETLSLDQKLTILVDGCDDYEGERVHARLQGHFGPVKRVSALVCSAQTRQQCGDT